MLPFPEYEKLDGIAISRLIKRGEISADEALAAARDRIERYNPRLNAVVHLPEKAEPVTPADGPLAGVPVLIKDLVSDVAGWPTLAGSRAMRGHVARQDGEVIRRYRAAGLQLVGKTATPEWGLHPFTESTQYGATRNPWQPTLTTGGSSGGSAAAVAAGMTPIAHGGDGGGSIRIPASHCGLFGLKPGRGRSPCGPVFSEYWQGFVSEHALTRSVRDSAAMLDILLSGHDPQDVSYTPPPASSFLSSLDTPPPRLRIAFTRQPFQGGELAPDCMAALDDSLALLASLGHHVEEAHPPLASPEAIRRAMLVMVSGEMAALAATLRKPDGSALRWEDMETDSWTLARYGELLSAGDFARMRQLAFAQGRIMAAFHQRYDVLVTPVLNDPPPDIGALRTSKTEQALSDLLLGKLGLNWTLKLGNAVEKSSRRVMEHMGWTIPFNMSGQPAMSVPLFWTESGLPIGTQFVAAQGREGLLLQLARELEIARPWFDRRPPKA